MPVCLHYYQVIMPIVLYFVSFLNFIVAFRMFLKTERENDLAKNRSDVYYLMDRQGKGPENWVSCRGMEKP